MAQAIFVGLLTYLGSVQGVRWYLSFPLGLALWTVLAVAWVSVWGEFVFAGVTLTTVLAGGLGGRTRGKGWLAVGMGGLALTANHFGGPVDFLSQSVGQWMAWSTQAEGVAGTLVEQGPVRALWYGAAASTGAATCLFLLVPLWGSAMGALWDWKTKPFPVAVLIAFGALGVGMGTGVGGEAVAFGVFLFLFVSHGPSLPHRGLLLGAFALSSPATLPLALALAWATRQWGVLLLAAAWGARAVEWTGTPWGWLPLGFVVLAAVVSLPRSVGLGMVVLTLVLSFWAQGGPVSLYPLALALAPIVLLWAPGKNNRALRRASVLGGICWAGLFFGGEAGRWGWFPLLWFALMVMDSIEPAVRAAGASRRFETAGPGHWKALG